MARITCTKCGGRVFIEDHPLYGPEAYCIACGRAWQYLTGGPADCPFQWPWTTAIREAAVSIYDPRMTRLPDDGCEVASRCVECPLSVCKWDQRRVRRDRLESDAAVAAAAARGLSARATVAATGLSLRTVFRARRRTGVTG